MDVREWLIGLLFRKRVIDEETGCWEWSGTRNNDGRGVMVVSIPRLAAMLWLDLDPDSRQQANHHCDNPACFFPEHLYCGSAADNARDRYARGRGRENRREPRSVYKLTAEDAAEIRRRVGGGASQGVVAAEFGISVAHVSNIVANKVWRAERLPSGVRGERHAMAKLGEAEVREIHRLYHEERVTQKVLAATFGVTQTTIERIVNGRSWKHLGLDAGQQMKRRRRWFSDGEVAEIRQLRDEGLSQAAIGERFGVTQAAISYVLSGKRRGGHTPR